MLFIGLHLISHTPYVVLLYAQFGGGRTKRKIKVQNFNELHIMQTIITHRSNCVIKHIIIDSSSAILDVVKQK